MPRMVTVTEAKAQLSRLLQDVQNGEEVVIGNAGRPVAVLRAYDRSREPRRLGGWQGKARISDDFDAPLPDDVLNAFNGPA